MALGGFGGGAALRSRLRRLFGAMGPSTLGKPADSSRASVSVRLFAYNRCARILLPLSMLMMMIMALVMVMGEVGACEGDADDDDDDADDDV